MMVKRHQKFDGIVVAASSYETKHYIGFDRTGALRNIHTYCPHIIKDAIEIIKQLYNYNCEDGRELTKVWLQLLHFNPSSYWHGSFPLDNIKLYASPTPF
jgi:hypothetical protein